MRRRARDLLATTVRGAVHFPRRVLELFAAAVHQRNRYLGGEITREQLQDLRDGFAERLLTLARPPRVVAEYERLAQHLGEHSGEWFAFLTEPAIEATNEEAEQALRPAVVNRKVWGGNRTAVGARAQGIVMSVLETCRCQAQPALA